MENLIIEIMKQFGYLGIGILIAVENLFPPIPSEVILTFGGFMTTYTGLNVWLVILSATMGSVAGAIILYYIGRLIKPDTLKALISGKVGSALYLKPTDVSRAGKWFEKKGNPTVFFCRFIPVIRSLISIPAGIANMNFSVFLIFTISGTAIWNTVLVWLGVFAGKSWDKIVGYMNAYSLVALFFIGIFTAIAAAVFYKRRIKPAKNNNAHNEKLK